MLKNLHTPTIADQYTDISGAALVKIASRLADTNLAETATQMLFALPDRNLRFTKTASFSTATPQDTLLSRVYLEGQKENMSQEKYAELDARIGKYEVLYHVSPDCTEKPRMTKTAEQFELIPGVVVSTAEDMVKVAEDFSENYNDLDYADRIALANEFSKLAELKDLPDDMAVYTPYVELRDDCIDQLGFRKFAAERIGRDGTPYDMVADMLMDSEYLDGQDMEKLAEVVHSLDDEYGFTDPSYDNRLPDAWHALFKKATIDEDTDDNDKEDQNKASDEMDKSDVIARYGEAALDEVENPDGTINQERLRQLRGMFGDTASKAESQEAKTVEGKELHADK